MRLVVVSVLSLLLLASCRNRHEDLPLAHPEDGYLTVALQTDPTDYFVYRGHPMGYHLELLEMLGRHLDCRLVVVNRKGLAEQHRLLHTGQVDLIASNLNVTPERKEHFIFTHALYSTPQVLVQLKKEYLLEPSQIFIDSVPMLYGREITVIKNSVFADRLHELNNAKNRNGRDKIKITEVEKSEEELLREVASGAVNYTVASRNKALHFALEHAQLDCRSVLSEPQDIAWALRQTDTLLLQRINGFIDSLRRTQNFGYLYHKYYELPTHRTVRSTESGFKKMDSVNHSRRQRHFELLVDEGILEQSDSVFLFRVNRPRRGPQKGLKPQISPFDTLLKKYAAEIPWDWPLLASLIYQESQFETHLISKKGAIGLMQFMPATAHRYKITLRSSEEAQIRAGVKYIKSLYSYFPDTVNAAERARFVLASYNIGPAHVLDARRLAAKHGADPDVWYDNVERYLLLLSKPEYYGDTACRNGRAYGRQTAEFVRRIEERYLHYRNFME